MSAGFVSGLMVILLIMLSIAFIVGLMQLNSQKLEEEHRELIKNLQTAFEEIKTLKGILPICARCKKIRDDNGCWKQIESCIREHSEADFSHGMCPECIETVYGSCVSRPSSR